MSPPMAMQSRPFFNPIIKAKQRGPDELTDIEALFRRQRGPDIKFPTSLGSYKNQGNSRKTSTFASLTILSL